MGATENTAGLSIRGSDGQLLTSEIKKLRLRISDYNQSPLLDAICLKMWKLMLVIQYEEILLELVDQITKLPLDMELYEALIPLY